MVQYCDECEEATEVENGRCVNCNSLVEEGRETKRHLDEFEEVDDEEELGISEEDIADELRF